MPRERGQHNTCTAQAGSRCVLLEGQKEDRSVCLEHRKLEGQMDGLEWREAGRGEITQGLGGLGRNWILS